MNDVLYTLLILLGFSVLCIIGQLIYCCINNLIDKKENPKLSKEPPSAELIAHWHRLMAAEQKILDKYRCRCKCCCNCRGKV